MLTETELRLLGARDEGWLAGYMNAAERAIVSAKSDDQRALAEQLLQEALEAQDEAYADAVYDGE